MTLDDIPADQKVEMTKHLSRLFDAAGCKPQCCHYCYKPIRLGDTFWLVTYKGRDQMLCEKHSVADLEERAKAAERERREWQRKQDFRHGHVGGYSRPSR